MDAWICLTVVGGREFAAATEVEKLGRNAFVPCEYVQTRGRGKGGKPVVRSRRVPMMPGYLFIRCDGDVPWFALTLVRSRRGPIITGALRYPGGLLARFAQSDIDALRAAAAQSDRPSGGRGYRRGDIVRARVGKYDTTVEARVVEIKSGLLRLESVLLGRAHRYDRRPDQVEAA
jgi:hypothetical protein